MSGPEPGRRALENGRFRALLLVLAGTPVLVQFAIASLGDTLAPAAGGAWRDYWIYLRAAAAIHAGGNPYAVFFGSPDGDPTRAGRYIYPPLWAWLLQPLAELPRGQAGLVIFVVSQLAFAAFVILAARALRSGWQTALLVYLLGAGSYWFFDVLHEGQVEAVLLALTGAWLLAWTREPQARWEWLGGVPLGVAAAIKLLQAPLLVLVAARGRWRQLAAAAGAVAAAWLVADPGDALTFWTAVLPALGGGTAAAENQSPAGALARVLGTGAAAHAAGLGVAVVLAAVTAYRLRRPAAGPQGRALEAAAVAALVPLVSPVTWGHHLFGELLPIFVVLHCALRGRRWWVVGAVAAAWALANPLHVQFMVLDRSGLGGGIAARLLEEGGLVAALVIWAAALAELRARHQDGEPEAGARRPAPAAVTSPT